MDSDGPNQQEGLNTFQEEVGSWADSTFPHATVASILAHIREEVTEELRAEADPSEAADVLLLLLHYAHKRDFDLFQEAQRKLSINRMRAWAPPNEHGVSYHI